MLSSRRWASSVRNCKADLDRLASAAAIPVDIVFEQGTQKFWVCNPEAYAMGQQNRIVKIGSQVLCDATRRTQYRAFSLGNLVRAGLLGWLTAGWQVLLVSSGAVAAGSGITGCR